MRFLLLIFLIIVACNGFIRLRAPSFRISNSRLAMTYYPKLAALEDKRAKKNANTKKGKIKIIERTRKLIPDAMMLMAMPIRGVTYEQTVALRELLPNGTVATVIKNRILAIALNGTKFEPLIPHLSGENMYFFIPKDINTPTFLAIQKWMKSCKRKPEDAPFAIAMDNEAWVGKENVTDIATIPTKQEFLTTIFGILKSNIERLGNVVNIITGRVPINDGVEGEEAVFVAEEDGLKSLELVLDIVKKRKLKKQALANATNPNKLDNGKVKIPLNFSTPHETVKSLLEV